MKSGSMPNNDSPVRVGAMCSEEVRPLPVGIGQEGGGEQDRDLTTR